MDRGGKIKTQGPRERRGRTAKKKKRASEGVDRHYRVRFGVRRRPARRTRDPSQRWSGERQEHYRLAMPATRRRCRTAGHSGYVRGTRRGHTSKRLESGMGPGSAIEEKQALPDGCAFGS